MKTTAALLLALLPTLTAGSGPTVEVTFVQPDTYTDVGPRFADSPKRQDALFALRAIFERAARSSLTDDDRIEISVQEVDLAGSPELTLSGRDLRLVRPADVPRIRFQYRLLRRGGASRQGEAQLTDLGHLDKGRVCGSGEALCHERRMVEAWFRSEFGK